MYQSFSSVLAFASLAWGHFVLQWPPTAGFDDDAEPTSPCGGATVTVNSSSPQINVDRFAASILVTHPVGKFAFYATTDTKEPYKFVKINQNVTSSGIGTFCENYLSAPSSFAGKPGVIQVVDDSIDGVLYQCAPVNFVSGSNNTLGSTCTNATGQSLTWTGPLSSNATNTTSSLPSQTSAARPTMSSGAAIAVMLEVKSLLAGLGAFAAGMLL